jgi:hypothetical protein
MSDFAYYKQLAEQQTARVAELEAERDALRDQVLALEFARRWWWGRELWLACYLEARTQVAIAEFYAERDRAAALAADNARVREALTAATWALDSVGFVPEHNRGIYVEARVGGANHRGDCCRYINDTRGIDDPTRYDNEAAEAVIKRCFKAIRSAAAALAGAPQEPAKAPCGHDARSLKYQKADRTIICMECAPR